MCTMSTKAYAKQELLTDPYLQNPTNSSVLVEWYTEYKGENNAVELYENGTDSAPTRVIKASTLKLSRMRGGKTAEDCENPAIDAGIYKHKAYINNLPKYHGKDSERVPYRVVSDGASSEIFTLAAKPQPGTPMKILLTSDLQTKDMCAANFAMVEKEIGRVDAILVNGDCVDVTDRAYDWFYSDNSFFRVLQGRADHQVGSKKYSGGSLIQYAPMYAAIGNHDVMGVYNDTDPLSVQFNNPRPVASAENRYDEADAKDKTCKAAFIRDHSYNTISYEEIFDLPISFKGGEKYYAVSIGDVRLIVLDTSRVWRLPRLGITGKYSELPGASEKDYGYGDFIFEEIGEGSDQLAFLEDELNRKNFTEAAYKLIMFHFQYHSLGGNQIPPFTDPVASKVTDPVTGAEMVVYDYPKSEDYIDKYVSPLLEKSGVNLLFTAHSHVWDRFLTKSGMHVLESSNIGNTYNCFYEETSRTDFPSALTPGDPYESIAGSWDPDNYVLSGDPYGLTPIAPNITDLPEGRPYLASNTVTAFSVLDTGKGTVDSYYYDTEHPEKGVVLFDSFPVK